MYVCMRERERERERERGTTEFQRYSFTASFMIVKYWTTISKVPEQARNQSYSTHT